MAKPEKFNERLIKHDEGLVIAENIIRPHTNRRHLPDRITSFPRIGKCMWDYKTNVFVEDNSHDEYFGLKNEGWRIFIVYNDDGELKAEWIENLNWSGPHPPSENSTSGDPYYKISGGKKLEDFLDDITQ